jgi:ribosomal protein S18 acetylase RimI-like enzyme
MSDLSLAFREGGAADKIQFRELGLLAYGQFAETLGPVHWPRMESGVGSMERWDELVRIAKSFVCLDGDKLVGMAFIIPRGNPWQVFKAEWSYIRMVGVRPGYEGRGIAKQLTAMCIEHARRTGERTIALHTSEFMDAARHIYESFGFRKLEEIPPLFGRKYWIYTLEL